MTGLRRLTPASLREITQARLSFAPSGKPLGTTESLKFSLDHAMAREAVLSELDVPRLSEQLTSTGLSFETVTSAARSRETFVKRPDLGRELPESEREQLAGKSGADVAIVLGDGLSAIAVALNGAAFAAALSERLRANGLSVAPIILARQARVALGDKIAMALGVTSVVMALGERPGLSAADSLGAYVTHHPSDKTQDSGRNCISNIRDEGISVQDAAERVAQLIAHMRATGLSGVALNQSLSALYSAQAPGLADARDD